MAGSDDKGDPVTSLLQKQVDDLQQELSTTQVELKAAHEELAVVKKQLVLYKGKCLKCQGNLVNDQPPETQEEHSRCATDLNTTGDEFREALIKHTQEQICPKLQTDNDVDSSLWQTEKLKMLEKELKLSQANLKDVLNKLSKSEQKYQRLSSYNGDLCSQVESLSRELYMYKQRAVQCCDVGLQVTEKDLMEECGESDVNREPSAMPVWESSANINTTIETEGPKSIADSLKEAAEEALSQSGVVYDENSGMYYDYNTGYYYDAERSLYYEPSSGTYYYYNSQSETYQFHSQVDLTQYNTQYAGYQPREHNVPSTEDQTAMDTDHSHPTANQKKKKTGKRNHKETGNTEEHRKKEKKKCREKKKKRRKTEMMEVGQNQNGQCHETAIDKENLQDTSTPALSGQAGDELQQSPAKNSAEGELTEESLEQATANIDGLQCQETNAVEISSEDSELEEGEVSDSSDYEESSDSDEGMVAEEQDGPESAVHWPPCIRVMVKTSDSLDPGTLFIITCTGTTIGREKSLGHGILIPDLQVSKMHADIQYSEELKKYVIKDHASQNGTFLNGNRLSKGKVISDVHTLCHRDVIQIGGSTFELHIHPGTETCDDCEPGQVMAKLQAQQKKEEQAKVLTQAERETQRRQQLKMIKKKYGLANTAYVDNKAAVSNPAYKDKAAQRRKEVGSDNPYQKDDVPASVHRAIPSQNKGHKMLQKMGWQEGEALGKSMQGIQEPIKINIRLRQTAGLGSGSAVERSMDEAGASAPTERWVKAQERFEKIENPENSEIKVKFDKQWVQGQTVIPDQGNIDTKASNTER